MTLDQRAARIAKLIVDHNCIPFYVAGTQHQQQAVIDDATKTVKAELIEFERDLKTVTTEREP